MKQAAFFILFFFSTSVLFADLSQNLRVSLAYLASTTLEDRQSGQLLYSMEAFDEKFLFQSGLSAPVMGEGSSFFIDFGGGLKLFSERLSLSAHLKFLNNVYAGYDASFCSLIPYLSLSGGRFYGSLGYHLRSLNTEANLYNLFAYGGLHENFYFFDVGYVYDFPGFSLGLELNNHDDFFAQPSGSYGLLFSFGVLLSESSVLNFDLGTRNSGKIGLAGEFGDLILQLSLEVPL